MRDAALSGEGSDDVTAQGFATTGGRKALLVNKRNHTIEIALPDAGRATALTVDAESGEEAARSAKLTEGKLNLAPFAVAVVSW